MNFGFRKSKDYSQLQKLLEYVEKNMISRLEENTDPQKLEENTHIQKLENTHIQKLEENTQPQNTKNFIYSIPLNIFQTWHTLNLPPNMSETVELVKKKNPEFRHFLYDDKMCREFIKNNFDEDVLHTFDKLKPGAYKSDLWRFCVLYIHGGIYLDIKYSCVNNFKLINLTDKEYYVRDRHHIGITGIYNALLVCKANNSILHECIKKIVINVKNNKYGHSQLDVTGPHMMSIFFDKTINNLDLFFDGDNINSNKLNKTILSTYITYREEQAKYQSNIYYNTLWNEKNI